MKLHQQKDPWEKYITVFFSFLASYMLLACMLQNVQMKDGEIVD